MIKKTITYTDFNGVTRTEDFYFHISQPELIELAAQNFGFDAYISRVMTAGNTTEMLKVWRQILELSIGKKSDDGKRFIKSREAIEEFIYSAAFPVLYMELSTNADAAIEFVNAVIPSELKQTDGQ